jgi:hypothetical protein
VKTFCIILTTLIFSAPTAVINPLLPFAILLLLYPLYRVALMRFIRSARPVNGGFMAAAILLVPIVILASMMDGGGFAVGPFYAEDFAGDFRALKPSGRVAYGPGQLVAYESDGGHGPILAYVERGKVGWASELKAGE